jgi:hypothetical protein
MKRTCIFSSLAFALAFSAAAQEPTALPAPEKPESVPVAQEPNPPAPPAPSLATTIQARLPSGVEDIVKLSKAQIGEEVIAGFIRNSGSTYSLSPKDVIYLRDQGVSDRIVNTMLEHRTAPEMTSDQNQNQPVELANSASVPYPPPYVQQVPVYVPAPVEEEPPQSTLYVIPYPARVAAYYGSSGFYGTSGYYSAPYHYCAPSTVVHIGQSSGRHWRH